MMLWVMMAFFSALAVGWLWRDLLSPQNSPAEKKLALLLLLVPCLALLIYLLLGKPDQAAFPHAEQQRIAAAETERMAAETERLRQEMATAPTLDGLILLAEAERALGQDDAAITSLRRALALEKDAPIALRVALMQSLLQREKGYVTQEILDIANALPSPEWDAPKFYIFGMQAINRGNVIGALRQWRQGLGNARANSAIARQLENAISNAEAEMENILGVDPTRIAPMGDNAAARSPSEMAATLAAQAAEQPDNSTLQLRLLRVATILSADRGAVQYRLEQLANKLDEIDLAYALSFIDSEKLRQAYMQKASLNAISLGWQIDTKGDKKLISSLLTKPISAERAAALRRFQAEKN